MILKKVLVISLSSCFLLASTAFCTYANPVGQFADWYQHSFQQVDKLGKAFEQENTRLEEGLLEQKDKKKMADEKEILAFYERTAADSKMKIENYQQAYLSHLIETKGKLGESNFKAFSEKKKQEISAEISQDVETYLADLLAD